MYEELVKSLRSIDEYDTGYAKLIYDAADAIEDLQEKLDDARMDASEWAESLEYMSAAKVKLEEQTRWIPVTERLPKDGKFVLGCNDDKHMMIAKYETETYDWYYKYTNYDFDIWDNEEQGPVCYWMPLPEPPKEET